MIDWCIPGHLRLIIMSRWWKLYCSITAFGMRFHVSMRSREAIRALHVRGAWFIGWAE